MRISVTAEDIKVGQQKSMYNCPIAFAIQRTTKEDASVGTVLARVGDNNRPYVLPQRAKEFILKFDSGELVEAFSFIMRKATLKDLNVVQRVKGV